MNRKKLEDIEIILSTLDMSPSALTALRSPDKDLKAIENSILNLEALISSWNDGLPPEFDGKDEDAEFRTALRHARNGALALGGIGLRAGGATALFAALGGGALPLINYFDDQREEERIALEDARAEAVPIGIEPSEFSGDSLFPGTTNEDVFRLIQLASQFEVVDSTEHMASLLAAISAAVAQEGGDPLGLGSSILDYLTGKELDELKRDLPSFEIPENFYAMSSQELVDEFVSQFLPQFLDAAGQGGQYTQEVMGLTQGASWTYDDEAEIAAEEFFGSNWQDVALEEPGPVQQLVLDHEQNQRSQDAWTDRYEAIADAYEQAEQAASLARQDEKLFDLAQNQWMQTQNEDAEDLFDTTSDLLDLSHSIEGAWAAASAQMLTANEEGLGPLTENAHALLEAVNSIQAAEVAAALGPQAAAQRRRRKEEELEDIVVEDPAPAPVLPTYTSRGITREQEARIFAFKGLIGLAEGGPLADLALVGERGPELIINGVVIPADQTRRLMALGLTPQRRFAAGGPMDPRALPQPQDAHLSHGGTDQALFAVDAHLQGADRSAHREEAGANLPQLLLDSVDESAGAMVESALGAASLGQSSIALELMQANHALVQDMRQALHESNGQLMQRVDRLAGLTERLILETKRTKFYFRDAVRFIVD